MITPVHHIHKHPAPQQYNQVEVLEDKDYNQALTQQATKNGAKIGGILGLITAILALGSGAVSLGIAAKKTGKTFPEFLKANQASIKQTLSKYKKAALLGLITNTVYGAVAGFIGGKAKINTNRKLLNDENIPHPEKQFKKHVYKAILAIPLLNLLITNRKSFKPSDFGKIKELTQHPAGKIGLAMAFVPYILNIAIDTFIWGTTAVYSARKAEKEIL